MIRALGNQLGRTNKAWLCNENYTSSKYDEIFTSPSYGFTQKLKPTVFYFFLFYLSIKDNKRRLTPSHKNFRTIMCPGKSTWMCKSARLEFCSTFSYHFDLWRKSINLYPTFNYITSFITLILRYCFKEQMFPTTLDFAHVTKLQPWPRFNWTRGLRHMYWWLEYFPRNLKIDTCFNIFLCHLS